MYSSRDSNQRGKTAKVTQKHILLRTRRARILGGIGGYIPSRSLTSYVMTQTAKK